MRVLARPLSIQLLLSLNFHRRISSMVEATESRQRLQRHLDAVTIEAAPRVELTCGTAESAAPSLAVLDSSFNPPTRAHLHLLSLAADRLGLSRSLLLLAKQNADKPVLGASLIQRLEMMELVAANASPADSVLCGVTAHPLFVDKATALRSLCPSGSTRVAILVGFDTWVRIIDPKYYPADGLEPALKQIFDAVEVVVASRDPSGASNLGEMSIEEQEARVNELPESVTQNRLHFVLNSAEMAPMSSSAIRKAVGGAENGDALPPSVLEMLPECLHAYVESQEGLYRE
jgi:nicotinamide-nucleotide adenylyltransferase